MDHEDNSARPCASRADRRDLQSAWNEALHLYAREDWTQSIARADLSAEIAAAIYLDAQVACRLNVSAGTLPTLLPAAGGLQGTLRYYLKHSPAWRSKQYAMIRLQKRIESLLARRDRPPHAASAPDTQRAAKLAFENSLAIIQALLPRQSAQLSAPR